MIEQQADDASAASAGAAPCRCAAQRRSTITRRFEVPPRTGGGWEAWAGAFGRLLDDLVSGPSHCLTITQAGNERYVQLLLGHGHVRLEVSSNRYLPVEHRLSTAEERHLRLLGFRDPDDDPDDGPLPANWSMASTVTATATASVAPLVAHILTTVTALDGDRAVVVEVFGADRPCPACSRGWWADAEPGAA